MSGGRFIISLDFELHWGVFDTFGDSYNENILGARLAILQILELFKRYEIEATWAIVGLLLNENKNDYLYYKPDLLPTYDDESLSAYNVEIGESEFEDPLHYGISLARTIMSYPGQEIGSHSYSHYYCKAKGQTLKQFNRDLDASISITNDKLLKTCCSFVFPKNMVEEQYLSCLKDHGFSVFRDVGTSKFKNQLLERCFRYLNSYIKIARDQVHSVTEVGGVKATVGSRFLRPHSSRLLSYLMVERIKKELTFAAKNNSDYHLWWHPHNFGKNTNENLDNLEKLLISYTNLKENFGMKSVSMRNL